MVSYNSKPESMRLICDGHKNRPYGNNTHSLQELNDNIQREMANIKRRGLCRMLRNI